MTDDDGLISITLYSTFLYNYDCHYLCGVLCFFQSNFKWRQLLADVRFPQMPSKTLCLLGNVKQYVTLRLTKQQIPSYVLSFSHMSK